MKKRGLGRFTGPIGGSCCIALGAAALWMLLRHPRQQDLDYLLGKAYAEQRTLELRFTQSNRTVLHVRTPGTGAPVNASAVLLEAELEIKTSLQHRPDDRVLLQKKAEAELLEWNYKAATDTLQKALISIPESPGLLEDLGIAYFESAEDGPKEYQFQEYEKALEYLSEALTRETQNCAFIFNRAVVLEKMSLLNQAIADWERLLTIENDKSWRIEADQQLQALRRKQALLLNRSQRVGRDDPKTTATDPAKQDPEEILNFAERLLLPSLSKAGRRVTPDYRSMQTIASYLDSAHKDPFLKDLVASSRSPSFQMASRFLARASNENNSGRAEAAYADAAHALDAFRGLHNSAGATAAQFEQAYALQFESRARDCFVIANNARAIAAQHHYAGLEIQFLIEEGICSNMQGKIGDAAALFDRAVQMANRLGFKSFSLRGLRMQASLKSDTGDEAGALHDIQAGLNEYMKGGISDIRAYSFYDLLSAIAEHQGYRYAQLEATLESVAFLPFNPNLEVAASARFRLANLAMELGERTVAEEQYGKAAESISELPRTPSVSWRLFEAKIGLARVQSLTPARHAQALDTLLSSSQELQSITNRHVTQQYYTTLGEIRKQRGEIREAQLAFARAISISQSTLEVAASGATRSAPDEESARSYLLLTELLFDSGRPEAALTVWESLQHGQLHQLNRDRGGNDPPGGNSKDAIPTVIIAVLPEKILIWNRRGGELHAVSVLIPSHELAHTVARFVDECSSPASDISMLRADGRSLFDWLIRPIEAWLPQAGPLRIDADRAIGAVPWEAMLDASGDYLGSRYAISVVSTRSQRAGSLAHAVVGPLDDTLIVAGPGVPESASETARISRMFRNSTVLGGRKATLTALKREIVRNSVLHFAGHAVWTGHGAALILADGTFDALSMNGLEMVPLRGLRNLKLAVFSACGTARPGDSHRVATLAEVFVRSGVTTVVASRWNIDSASTADFMSYFYEHLLHDRNAAAPSLQSAASSIRAMRLTSHPYYWAGFTVFTH